MSNLLAILILNIIFTYIFWRSLWLNYAYELD
jgi:hypothetical protein